MIDGQGADSIWYQMCADRVVELAEDARLIPEQISARTGISAEAVRKIRKRAHDREYRRGMRNGA